VALQTIERIVGGQMIFCLIVILLVATDAFSAGVGSGSLMTIRTSSSRVSSG
jgi:hypothetical protein